MFANEPHYQQLQGYLLFHLLILHAVDKEIDGRLDIPIDDRMEFFPSICVNADVFFASLLAILNMQVRNKDKMIFFKKKQTIKKLKNI